MNKKRFLHMGLLSLIIDFCIAFTPVQAASAAADEPGCEARLAARAVEAEVYDSRKYYGQYDRREGFRLVQRLLKMNAQLEEEESSGILTRERLVELGVIRFTDWIVRDSTNKQMQPYAQLELPFAMTSVYVPGKKPDRNYSAKARTIGMSPLREYDADDFQALFILLPGIGFESSTAKSMMDMGGTWMNGTNPGLELGGGRSLKFLSFPMDGPLNGTSANAPFGFGHPDAVMGMMRNAHLVLRTLYPGKPVVFGGRSHGGLYVAQYARTFSDFTRAIALNPSNPTPEILAGTIAIHEAWADPKNAEQARKDGFDTNFHVPSWTAHREFTGDFDLLGNESLTPVYLQLSREDKGYPPGYLDSWIAWCEQNPALRRFELFDGPHNLWRRPRDSEESRLFEFVLRGIKINLAPAFP